MIASGVSRPGGRIVSSSFPPDRDDSRGSAASLHAGIRWPRPLRLSAAALVVWAAVAVCPSRALASDPPLVANGGFEAPVVTENATYVAPASFAGWTVRAGAVRQAGASDWSPASGSQSMQFGQGGGILAPVDAIEQDVAVQVGHRYRLSFAHADAPMAPPGYTSCGSIPGLVEPLVVGWQGSTIATVPWSGGHLSDAWQHFSTLVTATAAIARLRIASERQDDFQDCGMLLDDVALSIPSASETTTSLSSSVNPSVSGQAVAFTATVIGGDPAVVPTGGVQFGVDGTPVGAPVALAVDGRATLAATSLLAGAHAVTAAYQPSAASIFEPSTAQAFTETVNKATTATTLSIAPDPSTAGQDTVLKATVAAVAPGSGTPTGTVQFAEADGTPIGSPQPPQRRERAARGVRRRRFLQRAGSLCRRCQLQWELRERRANC